MNAAPGDLASTRSSGAGAGARRRHSPRVRAPSLPRRRDWTRGRGSGFVIQRAHRAPRLHWSIRFAQQGEAAYRVHPCGGEVGAQAAHLSAPWENPELVMLSCRPPDEAQLLLEPQPQLPCPADVQEGLAPPPPIWPLMKSALRSGIDPGLRPSSPPDHIVFPDRLSPPPPRGERCCEREPSVSACWPTRESLGQCDAHAPQSWRG